MAPLKKTSPGMVYPYLPVAEGFFALQAIGATLAAEADVSSRETPLFGRNVSFRRFGQREETPEPQHNKTKTTKIEGVGGGVYKAVKTMPRT